MNLIEKLHWLQYTHGFTVYLNDLEYPHHVIADELAPLLDALGLCDSHQALTNAFRAWRAAYSPAHMAQQASEPLRRRSAALTGPVARRKPPNPTQARRRADTDNPAMGAKPAQRR